ncbi:MAG: hypothetical protein ACK4PR_02900, partial [Gammaproteobacteria bacterium]
MAGLGVGKNEKEAASWFFKATEQSHEKAQYNLGVMYANGWRGEVSGEQAVKWLLEAAKRKFKDAEYCLGIMFANGWGVAKDEKEAVRRYRNAAEEDNANAQYNLGLMYKNGCGVEENEVEALKWFRQAAVNEHFSAKKCIENISWDKIYKLAVQENANAQYDLGERYAEGYGVEKNLSQAINWFSKAAELKHIGAQFKLGQIYADNLSVARNQEIAIAYYHKAAEQGHAGAQYHLGVIYSSKGHIVEQDFTQAFRWYQLSANQGHAEAQHNLGDMYRNGQGVAKDEKEGMKWYQKAATQNNIKAYNNLHNMADNGNVEAQYHLGMMYCNDKTIEKQKEAVKWFLKAAEKKHAGAQFYLGLIYNAGHGVEKDLEEAVKWYRKAAELGHVDAQYDLGFMCEYGNACIKKSKKEAVKWYRKAAELGHVDAQYDLGSRYEYGSQGAKKDEKEAIKWYRKAAEQGHEGAQHNLGRIYAYGIIVEKDENEAVKWLIKAAEQGHIVARHVLKEIYANGRDVEKDEKEAVKWYQIAAEQGDANAQYKLGEMYKKGQGVKKDENAAIKWYRKAVEQDDVRAQYRLGEMYEKGQGVEKDVKEAVKLYRKAAEKGNVDAQRDLGVMYANGRGVEKDEKEAINWYHKAAEHDDILAQYHLGKIYANGRGVEKNEKIAAKWYERSANLGYAKAQFNLGMIYKNGSGVEKDESEAVIWYRAAAEQGHIGAEYHLGEMYKKGIGVKKDLKLAADYYGKVLKQNQETKYHRSALSNLQIMAARSDANAQYNLGLAAEFGWGMARNYDQTIICYANAAKKGHAAAQNRLGYQYYLGQGVTKDNKQALKWYLSAIELGDEDACSNLQVMATDGDAIAQYHLGLMYGKGHIVAKDDKQAVHWYQQSANQGYAEAQYALGVSYESGIGVTKNEKEAAKWYLAAAEQDNEHAQYRLGVMYAKGLGVKKDLTEAVEWFTEAAEKNNAAAQYNLGVMYDQARGVTKDRKRAVELYQLAANQNYAAAQYNLAMMYKNGDYLDKNEESAITWFYKAAQQKHAAAFKQLQEFAEKGLATAQYYLSEMYEHGRGVEKNQALASAWYDKAVSSRNQLGNEPLAVPAKPKEQIPQAVLATISPSRPIIPTPVPIQPDPKLINLLNSLVETDKGFLPYSNIADSDALEKLVSISEVVFPLLKKCIQLNAVNALNLLFSLKLPIDLQDKEGNTLMLLACKAANFALVKLCHEQGANVTITNNAQENIAWVLFSQSKQSIAQRKEYIDYLFTIGVPFFIPNEAKKCPYQLISKDKALKEYLLSKYILAAENNTDNLVSLLTAIKRMPLFDVSSEYALVYQEPWVVSFQAALKKENYAACALLLRHSANLVTQQGIDVALNVCSEDQYTKIQEQLEMQMHEAKDNKIEVPDILIKATYCNRVLSEQESQHLYSRLRGFYTELYINPSIKPILELVALATQAKHHLAREKRFTTALQRQFSIYVDPYHQRVSHLHLGNNGLGLYKDENAIYVAAKAYTEQTNEVRETAVHEMAHFAARELFGSCKPYKDNQSKAKALCDTVLNIFQQKKSTLPAIFAELFDLYKEKKWPNELLARTVEYVSRFQTEEKARAALRNHCVEWETFYFDSFLPVLKKHIADLEAESYQQQTELKETLEKTHTDLKVAHQKMHEELLLLKTQLEDIQQQRVASRNNYEHERQAMAKRLEEMARQLGEAEKAQINNDVSSLKLRFSEIESVLYEKHFAFYNDAEIRKGYTPSAPFMSPPEMIIVKTDSARVGYTPSAPVMTPTDTIQIVPANDPQLQLAEPSAQSLSKSKEKRSADRYK